MNNLNNNTLNLQTILTQINNLPIPKGEFLKYINRETSSIDDDKITKVKDCAFAFCSNLSSVNLPNCEIIGEFAFQSCPITSMSFPACTNIGSYAFYTCSFTSVNFPACTTIGSYAFRSCHSLTSVSFPACTTIYEGAFQGCSSLTSVNFPACTTIGNYVFRDCKSLTTVSFPACTNIGSNAFQALSLTTANFPVCKSVGSWAFWGCNSLTTVNIPQCTVIGSSAFRNCYYLTSLYLNETTAVCTLSNSQALVSTPVGGYSTKAGKYGSIYVPASLLTSYKTATNWSYYSARMVGI